MFRLSRALPISSQPLCLNLRNTDMPTIRHGAAVVHFYAALYPKLNVTMSAQACFLGRAGAPGGSKVQRGGGDNTNGGGRSFIFGGRDDSNLGAPATEQQPGVCIQKRAS